MPPGRYGTTFWGRCGRNKRFINTCMITKHSQDIWKTWLLVLAFTGHIAHCLRTGLVLSRSQPGLLSIFVIAVSYTFTYNIGSPHPTFYAVGLIYGALVYWGPDCAMSSIHPSQQSKGFELFIFTQVLLQFIKCLNHHNSTRQSILILRYDETTGPLPKSYNATFPYPTMHNFVIGMCTCVHISVTKWCIKGYLYFALWHLLSRPGLKLGDDRLIGNKCLTSIGQRGTFVFIATAWKHRL